MINYLKSAKVLTGKFTVDYDLYFGDICVCLGFTGMKDGIVLVNRYGRVVHVEYDEEYFNVY